MLDLSAEHVLLTGGTGFFGRSLLRKWLIQANKGEKIASVTILSRNQDKFLKDYPEFNAKSWLNVRYGDVLNKNTLPNGEKYSYLLHAATDSTYGPQLVPFERFNQIVDGTRNMLDFAVNNKIKRFLLTSSGGVYGSQPLDMDQISESYNAIPDPLNPENAYGMAKRCAEHLCILYKQRHGIEIVIARCFSFVGKDLPLNVHFAIGNFIHDALHSNNIIIKGDGTSVRTYMDQRDLASWLDILLYHGENGEAYNIGSDIAITIKELAILVRNVLSPNKEIIITRESNSYNRNKYVPSIEKFKNKFRIEMIYNLEESLQIFKDKNEIN